MLWQRITFGAFMIAALIGLIWADDYFAQQLAEERSPTLLINVALLLHEGLLLTLVVAVLAVFAVREMSRLLRGAGHQAAAVWAAIACLGLIFIPWFVRNNISKEVSADITTDYTYTLNWLIAMVVGTFLVVGARRRTAGAAGAIGSTLLIILYIGVLSGYLVRIRMWGSAWLVLYVLFVVKICDIGAYFTGMAIGRNKLIEWLSPKKTWEGLLGGVVASALLAIGLAKLAAAYGPLSLRTTWPGTKQAAIFGVLMAVIGQMGDLVESLFKRDAQAKDSGAVVPSFGGVMDIIDSPLLTAPIAFWMLVKL